MSFLTGISRRERETRRAEQVAGCHRVQSRWNDHHREREFSQCDGLQRSRKSAASITACSSTRTERDSAEYRAFWDALRRGEYQARNSSGSPRAAGRCGSRPPTIPDWTREASHTRWSSSPPTSPTQKLRNADYEGQLKAIHKSQAVIEFNLDGTSSPPTTTSSKRVGYSLAEIQGKHHRMFVEPDEREARPTGRSGKRCGAANIRRPNTSGSERAAGRSGFRHPTIRSRMPTARS